MIPLLLLLARTAGAHVVHDDVGGLAIPDDFESAGRAWVLLRVDRGERGRAWDILETTDGGRSWDPVPPPSLPGDPRSMGAWDGAPVLGLDDGGLLVLEGADWRSLEGPGAVPLALDGSGTVLASASSAGLHLRLSPEEDWALVSPVPATTVDLAPDGAISALGSDRRVYAGDSGGLVERPGLPGRAIAVAGSRAALYAASPEAVYAWRDGSWAPCAPLPAGQPDEDGALVVTALALGEGGLLVGTGQELFHSSDGCASFSELRPFPDPADYDSTYGALDTYAGNTTGLWVGATLGVVGGYRGLSVGAMQGQAWAPGRLLDGSFVRDLSLLPAREDQGERLVVTSYSAALLVQEASGSLAPVTGSEFHGSDWYGRAVGALPGSALLYTGDIRSFRSDDGGGSFSDLLLPIARVGGFHQAIGRLWCSEYAYDEGSLLQSADGVDWTEVALGAGGIVSVRDSVLDGVAGMLVHTEGDDGVRFSTDGEVFEVLVVGGEPTEDLLSWPPDQGDRLVQGTGSGLYLSDDRGRSFRRALAGPSSAMRLAAGDDGTLFALDRGDRLWRSEDGGETWAALAPSPVSVQDIVVFPDFASRGLLAVATLRGTLWSSDRGQSWTRAPGAERLRTDDPDLRRMIAGVDERVGSSASIALAEGDALWVQSRGVEATVEGSGTGTLAVQVDGEELGTVGVGTAIALPGEGWRELRWVLKEGSVEVSAIRLVLPGQDLPLEEAQEDSGTASSPPPTACGCAASRTPGVAAASSLLLLILRTRRRPPGPPRRLRHQSSLPGLQPFSR